MKQLKTEKIIKSVKAADSKSLVKWKLTPYEIAWKSVFIAVVIAGSFMIKSIIRF